MYKALPGFMGPETAASLLAYAVVREADFTETTLGTHGRIDPEVRRSKRLGDLATFGAIFEKRVMSTVPGLTTDLQLTPFEPSGLELEIVAHGDGAFYSRHIDLFTGSDKQRQSSDRLISIVYYFNEEPKRYQGGELRLFPQHAPERLDEALDITPEHDLAIAFSSWLPHEVRPVVCVSRQFRHARFALNCWVLR